MAILSRSLCHTSRAEYERINTSRNAWNGRVTPNGEDFEQKKIICHTAMYTDTVCLMDWGSLRGHDPLCRNAIPSLSTDPTVP